MSKVACYGNSNESYVCTRFIIVKTDVFFQYNCPTEPFRSISELLFDRTLHLFYSLCKTGVPLPVCDGVITLGGKSQDVGCKRSGLTPRRLIIRPLAMSLISSVKKGCISTQACQFRPITV